MSKAEERNGNGDGEVDDDDDADGGGRRVLHLRFPSGGSFGDNYKQHI